MRPAPRDRVYRELKCSNFAVALRDLHRTVRQGLISACDEVFPHRREKRLPPRGLDVLEFLAIHPGGAAIALRDAISLLKSLGVRDMHEQTQKRCVLSDFAFR
jgi:hypothetical protein